MQICMRMQLATHLFSCVHLQLRLVRAQQTPALSGMHVHVCWKARQLPPSYLDGCTCKSRSVRTRCQAAAAGHQPRNTETLSHVPAEPNTSAAVERESSSSPFQDYHAR
jgi:hypothetical protein